MKDYNELAAYVAVVKAGSYTKAAKNLQIQKSTLSRKVAALEARLGITLLKRTTRKIVLTKEGEELFQRALSCIENLDTAESLVVRGQDEPRGMIRMTAPIVLGSALLPSIIASFLKIYPKIHIDLVLDDRIFNLYEHKFDLAIRAGKLSDSSLKIVKIGSTCFKFYSSKKFYQKYALNLLSIKDIEKLPALYYSPDSEVFDWEVVINNKKIKLKPNALVTVNNLDSLLKLACLSLGLCFVPEFIAENYVKQGQLVCINKNWVSIEEPVFLVYPNQSFMPKILRLWIDFLLKELKKINI
jgi:DNA-binding transcriptional LysR family regulator